MKENIIKKVKEDLKNKKIVAIKNYKEMCKYLEEEEQTNRTKKEKQIENWKRFVKIERVNQTFLIKKIYEHSIEKKDSKEINNIIDYNICLLYLKNNIKVIREIINTNITSTEFNRIANQKIQKIIQNGNNEYHISEKELAIGIELINQRYLSINNKNKKEISEEIGVDINNIQEYVHRVNSYYKEYISKGLDRLSKNNIIEYRKEKNKKDEIIYYIRITKEFYFQRRKTYENKINKIFVKRIIENKKREINRKTDSKDIKDLKQSYEDFRVLTRELIKESKSEEK